MQHSIPQGFSLIQASPYPANASSSSSRRGWPGGESLVPGKSEPHSAYGADSSFYVHKPEQPWFAASSLRLFLDK